MEHFKESLLSVLKVRFIESITIYVLIATKAGN